MKATDFKKIIKSAVKEAIQEELKDILLEAVRSPKTIVNESITPSYNTPTYTQPKPSLSESEKRNMFKNMIGDMARGADTISMTTDNIPFRPTATNTAAEGSSLPPGEVSLDQIMGLMK
jgi:hypothetical protein